jgi:flagellar biosynthetic protein FlhB
MAEEPAGEKNLAPTEKRLREAAEGGDVLRSKELAVAASVLVGAMFLKVGAGWLLSGLTASMRMGFTWNHETIANFAPRRMGVAMLLQVAPPVLILGTLMAAVAVLTQLGPSPGGRFMMSNLAPKFGRINPLTGITKIFGANGWIEAAKGILKVALLGTIAYNWTQSRLSQFIELSAVGLSGQMAFAWESLISLLLQLGGGLVVIAMLDFPLQWYRRMKRLKMSLQEVKDESKESEGSPEAKGARRQRQRQLAMNAIAGAMKKAQFVVTNPTHFAVAMTWDPDLAPAPVVLAKGRGEKALAIRELAAEHGIPCLEFPSLARSLYYTTRERQVIREELYVAVAGILSFIMALKRGEARPAPAIEVPVALRFDAEGRPDPQDKHVVEP